MPTQSNNPWRTGIIPCAGWYYLRHAGPHPVWLVPHISETGYDVLCSPGPEDVGWVAKSPKFRPALQQMTVEQSACELNLMRSVPSVGDWGVLDGDDHGPDGQRPVDWRGTESQAADLAKSMGLSWVVEITKVDGGWSYGSPCEVDSGVAVHSS